jgi:hypothetical protein
MINKLTNLLSTSTPERTVKDYEEMYDDFVNFAGGSRIDKKFEIPVKKKNADYYFDLDQFEIILELKQLSKYSKFNTVDQYFLSHLSEKKIKKFEHLPNNRIIISPDSLEKPDWNDFYKRFRPSVSKNLTDAAVQLRDTENFLPPAQKRRIKGVMLINSGDFNLPTDLLFRLIEWKTKREWKMKNFRSIDFVSCTTIDMYKENQHPLYARHIARSIQDNDLVKAAHYLYDRWLHYAALALGLEIHYREGMQDEEIQTDLSQPFAGKIILINRSRDQA